MTPKEKEKLIDAQKIYNTVLLTAVTVITTIGVQKLYKTNEDEVMVKTEIQYLRRDLNNVSKFIESFSIEPRLQERLAPIEKQLESHEIIINTYSKDISKALWRIDDLDKKLKYKN